MLPCIATPKDTCIVIGNGFDINLGLPTSYADFVKSTHFDDMVKRGNELAKHLKSKFELQNWIDIENELKSYSLKKVMDLSSSITSYLLSL